MTSRMKHACVSVLLLIGARICAQPAAAQVKGSVEFIREANNTLSKQLQSTTSAAIISSCSVPTARSLGWPGELIGPRFAT